MIVVYTGRRPSDDDGPFPARHAAFVRDRLERLLAGLRPRLAVGSAAAGADLTVATAALDAGAAADLILAGTSTEFRANSVSDKGDEWTAVYDGLLRRDRVAITEVPVPADDDGYASVNRVILDRATAELNTGEELVVIAVSGGRRPGRDHTEQLAEEATAAGRLVVRVDPTIGRDDAPVAFAAMPYGLRKDPLPGRPDYDADATWHRILVPLLIDAGMRPVRVDLEASLEIIDAKMIRAIGRARLLVADLAHHNPNVFWELGVRHAWVPGGTLLIAPTGSPRPPFDVNHVTVHEYARDAAGVTDRDAVAAVRALRPVVASASTSIDSPVFAALPGLAPQQVPVATDPASDERITAVAERISLASDLGRAEDLIAEAATLTAAPNPGPANVALREQIGLALLDLDRPSDALPILESLANADLGCSRPLLQQRYALALMRASGRDDQGARRLAEAETRLSRLNDIYPGSGETLGLLGSVAKRMHEAALAEGRESGGELDRAIVYYEAGLAAEPTEYYPGINAIALLRLRFRSRGEVADADRARALVPVVRYMLERPRAADSVWRRATAAELLLHEYLLDGRPNVESCAREYAHAAVGATPFELASMRKQLALFAATGDPQDVIDRVLAALPAPV